MRMSYIDWPEVIFGSVICSAVAFLGVELIGYNFTHNAPDYCYLDQEQVSSPNVSYFKLQQHRPFGFDLVLLRTTDPQELGAAYHAFCPQAQTKSGTDL